MTGDSKSSKKWLNWSQQRHLSMRHKPNCYLHTSKLEDDFHSMRKHTLALGDEKKEQPWWQSGRYVLDPESMTLQLWYIVSNILYMFSLFSTPLIIAFEMRFLEKLEMMESFFDLIMLIDIILVFFTAVELPPTRRKAPHVEKPSILKDRKKE